MRISDFWTLNTVLGQFWKVAVMDTFREISGDR